MSGLQSNTFFARDGQSPNILQRGGAILRGSGPPSPAVGHRGNVYIDVTTWNLYQRRQASGLDPWGFPLFTVPEPYRYSATHYGPGLPASNIGNIGDYYFQWGCDSAGVFPFVHGPKAPEGWPGSADGTPRPVAQTNILPIGLLDEGAPIAFPSVVSVLYLGLADELVSGVAAEVATVLPIGVSASGFVLDATLNPQAFAEAEHAV
jgi:hypothetical protein